MKVKSARRQDLVLARGLNRAVAARSFRGKIRSICGRVRAFLWFDEEGGPIVEMALVVPVLMAVFTGIFAFGIAFSNQLTLQNAVSTGAQYLATIRTSTTDPCADTFAVIKNAAPGLNSSNIAVTITMNGVTPTQTGNTCSGAQTNLVQQTSVSVSATYPCTLGIYGANFVSGCKLGGKVTEYEY